MQVVDSNNFPERLFKKSDWQTFFFEGWDVFDEFHFKKFVMLTSSLNEDTFYITNSDYSENFYKLVKCDMHTEYKDYLRMVNDDSELTSAYNLFLFSTTLRWVVYIDTFHDLMIVGFERGIEKVVSMIFNDVAYRIESREELKDYLEKIKSVSDLNSFMDKVDSSHYQMKK